MTDYLIHYPSGQQLRLNGELALVPLPGRGRVPALDNGGEIFVLDPRAVILERVYGPRDLAPGELDPDMAEWLDGHPGWDPIDAPAARAGRAKEK